MKFLFIFMFYIVCGYSFSNDKSASNIELDMESPKQILNLFRFMRETDSKDKIKEKIDSILSTKAFQTMLLHYNRDWNPKKLSKDSLKYMILSLKFKNADNGFEHNVTKLMRPVWEKYYKNIQLFEKEISNFEKINIDTLLSRASEKAKEYLPPNVKIPIFYFFIHPNGRSNGFIIGNSHGLDFFQLPKNKDGGIDIEHLEIILSHEIHHLGISTILPSEKYKTKEEVALNVLVMPIAEGVANKFINNAPGGCIKKIFSNKKSYFSDKELVGWKQYSEQEGEIFKRYIDLFERAYLGKLSKDQFYNEFNTYWVKALHDSKPRFYFLGSEIMGAIHMGLGKQACLEVMANPSLLFKKYMEALHANAALMKSCPSIPQQIITQSIKLNSK